MMISREAEPVLLLAAVEHHLQRAQRQRQHGEAGPGERQALLGFRVRHEQQQPDDGDDAERQVDVEHVAPVVPVGQVAAERRAHQRPHRHAGAEDRHRLGTARIGVDVEHRRLRQRHQRRTAHALQQAEQHDLLQALRRAAHHGGDGEAGQADDVELLAAEAHRHPADRCRHDRGGDDVGREHPGDLVGRGRHAALHVGQRHVGDGGVERLHQRGQHDATGDQRAMRHLGFGGGRLHPWSSYGVAAVWTLQCGSARAPLRRRAAYPSHTLLGIGSFANASSPSG